MASMCVQATDVIPERMWLCYNFQQTENMNIKSLIFCDIMLFILLKISQCFGCPTSTIRLKSTPNKQQA
jgi:hypothetical protein